MYETIHSIRSTHRCFLHRPCSAPYIVTTSNAQGPTLKPEKTTLEVAIAATGPLYLPLLLAAEAGYFNKRGLTRQHHRAERHRFRSGAAFRRWIFTRAARRRFMPTSPARM